MDSLSFALCHLSNLINSLNKKNFKSNVTEISQVVNHYGSEAERHFYRCLFSAIDFSVQISGACEQRATRDFLQVQYLALEINSLIAKPNFISLLCYAIDKPLEHQKTIRPSPHLLNSLGRTLRLNRVQEVTIALALLSSTNEDTRQNALQWVRMKLPDLLRAYVDADVGGGGQEAGGGLQEISIEVVHQILALMREDLDQFGITEELLEAFLKTLRKDFPKQRVPVVLSPLLYREPEDLPLSKCFRESGQSSLPQTSSQTSLNQIHQNDAMIAQIMKELGYNCAATLDDMRITLAEFSNRDLTAAAVARCIIMFMRTCDGSLRDQIGLQSSAGAASSVNWKSDDFKTPMVPPAVGALNLSSNMSSSEGAISWNVDNFMVVVKELNPSLQFRQVIMELDQEDFLVESKASFQILKQCLFRGLSDQLPIELFYRPWQNAIGQLSFFSKCLVHPDVICLAYWRYRSADVTRLKQHVDEENRDMLIWRNIDFVEALVRLSDQGLYAEVKKMFYWPLVNCPDLLILSLIQSIETSGLNTLKQELVSELLLFFLQPHVNSGSVFQMAWIAPGNNSVVRTLVLHVMIEWYEEGIALRPTSDYGRINRILDIIVDLKALATLLSSRNAFFCVDLACLATKREYLKMEKWLTDKINEGGEPFAQTVLRFLACRCPRLIGQTEDTQSDLSSSICSTMLNCLKYFQGRMSLETQEMLNLMIRNCEIYRLGSTSTAVEVQSRQLAAYNMLPAQLRPGAPGGALSAIGSSSTAHDLKFHANLASVAVGTGASPIGPPKSFNSTPGAGAPHSMQPVVSSVSPSTSLINNSSVFGGNSVQPNQFQNLGGGGAGSATSSAGLVGGLQKFAGPSPVTNPSVGSSAAAHAALKSQVERQLSAAVVPLTQSVGQPPGPPRMPPQAPEPLKDTLPEMPSIPEELRRPIGGTDSHGGMTADAREADDCVNNLMAALFRNEVTADQVLARVKVAFNSEDPKQKEFYRYFMKIVSEEFVHIPVQFPEVEATLMAHLYGGIINEGVAMMVHNLLSFFIRLLWTAVGRELKTPYDERMFVVGITALWVARVTIKSFKMLAQKMMQSINFHLYPRDLRDIVIQTVNEAVTSHQFQQQQTVLTAGVPPQSLQMQQIYSGSSAAAATDNQISSLKVAPISDAALILSASSHFVMKSGGNSVLTAAATNDSVLPNSEANDRSEEVLVPSEVIQDRIFFIFNNVSQMNIETKAAELKEVVPEEFMPWLGQYLVMKRVTTEPNFHNLFVQLIELLDIILLKNMVKDQVFRNIRALLRNMKPDLQDFNDRTLLKNLGRFLGLLTLAKNRPILFDEMNFKDLLLEAYRKGQVEMHYVVPFVARTLEGAGQSVAFKPPNPWTMGIIRVLKELHMDHNVKMNLKFEVEILCKNLMVNFETLEAAFYLRDPSRVANLDMDSSQCMVVHGKGYAEQLGSSSNEFDAPVRLAANGGPNMAGFSVNSLVAAAADFHSVRSVGVGPGGMKTPLGGTDASGAQPQHNATSGMVAAVSAAQNAAAQQNQSGAASARYRWQDINVTQPTFLRDNIVFDESLPFFQAQPALRANMRGALERAITELLAPVSERCVRITMTTVENIVRKDFALDHDEHRFRTCAHNMARFLTAGMALITIREALALNMVNQVKNVFLQALRNATQQQKELIETAATQIAADNTELGTAYIQKCCVEKALQDLDQRLAPDFALRIKCKEEGRHYLDQSVLAYQTDYMPRQLRKKVGDPSVGELAVYNEYAHTVPGFAHASPIESTVLRPGYAAATATASSLPASGGGYNSAAVALLQNVSSGGGGAERSTEVSQLFEKIVTDIERQMQGICQISRCSTSDRLLLNLRHLSDAAHLAQQQQHELINANNVIAKTVHSLFECYSRSTSQSYSHEVMERYKEAHLNTLRMMTEPMTYGYSWVCKHVLKAWIDLPEEHKWNSEAFMELLKIHVINLLPLDSHLCKLIAEAHFACLRFMMELFYRLILTEQKEYTVLNEWDLTQSMDALNRLVNTSGAQIPDDLVRMNCQLRALLDLGLLEQFQQASTSYLYSGCSQAREFDDPPGLSEKSEVLMKQWFTIYNSQMQKDIKSFNSFVQQMHVQGILKTDDLITRFFRLATDYVVERCLNKLKQETQCSVGGAGGIGATRAACYVELDAFIRLVSMLVKHSGEQSGTAQTSAATTKVNLLNKVLGIICGTLLQEHDIRSDWFHPMPFQRILIMLFLELNSSEEQVLQNISFNIMAAFANALHIVRPSRAPAFTFSWLEVVSHRLFINRYLANNNSRAHWPMYAQLMLDLMKFLQPFLINALLPKGIQLLYKGTLRVQLVLMHDFPDFICEYHALLCDVIPPNCIQLRNLILSAFPKGTRLQDPFMPSLRIDAMPEVQRDPQGPFDFLEENIQPAKFLADLDSFLVNRQPVTFLTEMIRTYLRPITTLIGDSNGNGVQLLGVAGLSSLPIGNLSTGRYNMQLINATVLHVGRSGIRATRDKNLLLNMTTIAHTPQMDIFQSLVINLDTEGRYMVLNAMVNQLRYPNSHTFYFNQVILYLFHEVTSTETVQEQIIRVLLERLIVARPHPWGLLVTFVELMRNPTYKFWERPFLRCAPEIEKLLETVWRSCRLCKVSTATTPSSAAAATAAAATAAAATAGEALDGQQASSNECASTATLSLIRSTTTAAALVNATNGPPTMDI